jgi:hypothetical protein
MTNYAVKCRANTTEVLGERWPCGLLDGAEMSRTAIQILEELFHHVAPPQRVAIELIESSPAHANDPNWVAAMGSSDAHRNEKSSQKVADLSKTDANVDWSGIEERVGQNRHATRWLSEI